MPPTLLHAQIFLLALTSPVHFPAFSSQNSPIFLKPGNLILQPTDSGRQQGLAPLTPNPPFSRIYNREGLSPFDSRYLSLPSVVLRSSSLLANTILVRAQSPF